MAQCRKCDACRSARKRSWIGRMLAEEQTSDHVWFVTFTFGGGYDNPDAAHCDYSHLTKAFKKLKRKGFRFRYVSVSEYGKERGRAHFHALLFWEGNPPEAEFSKDEYTWPHWDHGFTYIEIPRSKQGCAVYLMDYLDKDNLENNALRYSKKPQIGEKYCTEYARKAARAGTALFQTNNVFTIPNNFNARGELFTYAVGPREAMYTKMLDAYFETWSEERPLQRMPMNDHTYGWLEDIAQNPEREISSVQLWLHRVYDVGGPVNLGVGILHIPCETVPGLTITRSVNRLGLQMANEEGTVVWTGDLGQVETIERIQGEKQWLDQNEDQRGGAWTAAEINQVLKEANSLLESALTPALRARLSKLRRSPSVQSSRQSLPVPETLFQPSADRKNLSVADDNCGRGLSLRQEAFGGPQKRPNRTKLAQNLRPVCW